MTEAKKWVSEVWVDMEMVLKLRKQGMGDIRWERGVRVCLLLALSCILYCCVVMYGADYRAKTEDTAVYSQKIKQNGSMCAGYMEHICRNAGKTFVTYDWKPENAAAHGLAKQREHTGFTERMKCPEIREMSITQDFKSFSGISQEGDIPVKDIPFIEEETKGDIPFIEIEDEAEDNMSSVEDEDESAEDNNEMREIAGFLVDNQGYIVGVTEALSFTDGILAITSDSECIGIRGNAFTDVEEDVFDIYIPENICEIEPGAFDVFANLMYIEVSEESLYYYSMDGVLYSKSGEEIAYPAGR